jgi:hypothetical protein
VVTHASCGGGLLVLQCANDNLIFVEHDLDQAKNTKLLFMLFEQAFGPKKISIRTRYTALENLSKKRTNLTQFLV